MRISDWSSDVCSSDLARRLRHPAAHPEGQCALVLSGDRYARRLAGRAVALEAGIRDWGVGIRNSGVLATIRIPPVQSESPIPNPESPIPAPMHDTLLLFGATGDLAQRYLFPSLLPLLRDQIGQEHVRTPYTNAHLVYRP